MKLKKLARIKIGQKFIYNNTYLDILEVYIRITIMEANILYVPQISYSINQKTFASHISKQQKQNNTKPLFGLNIKTNKVGWFTPCTPLYELTKAVNILFIGDK